MQECSRKGLRKVSEVSEIRDPEFVCSARCVRAADSGVLSEGTPEALRSLEYPGP